MIKRFFIGLVKTVIGLCVSLAVIAGAVYYIYNEFAIDSQVLIDEYEQIKVEKPVRTPPPTPVPTPRPTPKPDWPELDVTSWEFLLANADNNIGEYKPPEVKYFDGVQIDTRIAQAATKLLSTARSYGYSVYLSDGYKDYDTIKTAYEKAKTDDVTCTVSEAGTNEHQTGLSFDILPTKNTKKDAKVANTELADWLKRHAPEYGFILRYPEGKEEITGVPYSPWHYRYVGEKAAAYITKHNLCLEEFLALYE